MKVIHGSSGFDAVRSLCSCLWHDSNMFDTCSSSWIMGVNHIKDECGETGDRDLCGHRGSSGPAHSYFPHAVALGFSYMTQHLSIFLSKMHWCFEGKANGGELLFAYEMLWLRVSTCSLETKTTTTLSHRCCWCCCCHCLFFKAPLVSESFQDRSRCYMVRLCSVDASFFARCTWAQSSLRQLPQPQSEIISSFLVCVAVRKLFTACMRLTLTKYETD